MRMWTILVTKSACNCVMINGHCVPQDLCLHTSVCKGAIAPCCTLADAENDGVNFTYLHQGRRCESLTSACHPKAGPTIHTRRQFTRANMQVPSVTKLALPNLGGLAYQQACCTALQQDWHSLHQQTNESCHTRSNMLGVGKLPCNKRLMIKERFGRTCTVVVFCQVCTHAHSQL